MSERRTLVVGTTSDYIDLILFRFPARALFITEPGERARASEPPPDQASELLCDLAQPEAILAALRGHLRRFDITPCGVACFDCESMSLASRLAAALDLPYPSADAVAACRSKFISKRLWSAAGLPCPRAQLVRDAAGAARFLDEIARPAMLKPVTGSGSELLFVCSTPADCAPALDTMRRRLAEHWDARMYAPSVFNGERLDPRSTFIIEELVRGSEYSCDFVIDGGRADIIRIALKIPAAGMAVGTTLAYILPAPLPHPPGPQAFRSQLAAAALALGIRRAVCMLDFMIEDGAAKMIEIAPRPGGDCLPWLIRQSCGLDMLGLALDIAEGRPLAIPPPSAWRPLVGLRLFADRTGVIRRLDDSALRADPRVLECFVKRKPGHRVVLPPEDYDSRLLGHAIFDPAHGDDVESECRTLAALLHLDWEPAP